MAEEADPEVGQVVVVEDLAEDLDVGRIRDLQNSPTIRHVCRPQCYSCNNVEHGPWRLRAGIQLACF